MIQRIIFYGVATIITAWVFLQVFYFLRAMVVFYLWTHGGMGK